MLRSLKEILNYHVNATDGNIGHVRDFYFDDRHWTIRYLVVDTSGFWESPSNVLVSPVAFREAEWATRKFHLAMTSEKVKNSPPVPQEGGVSRQFEQDYYQYYNWPYYWGYGGVWGDWGAPRTLAENTWRKPKPDHIPANHHLKLFKDLTGSVIQGSDDSIGHVQDLVVDDSTWVVRYIVVDTRDWWSGKSVLLAPRWIERIDAADGKVHVNLPRKSIKNSPEWEPDQPVNREYEVKLFDYYGRPAYWKDEPKDVS